MISVCMATYNGGKYIREQIDSILAQLSEDDELIISDDNSTDNTVDIIKQYNDKRITLLEYKRDKTGLKPVNLATTNFENALRHSKGDIIFLSDQDDVWLPNKVAVSLEYIDEQGYDYIVSDCFVTDSNLDITAETRFDGSFSLNRWKALVARTPYQGSCAAFRRSVLEKSMPFPKGLQSHDRWIGFIASFAFKYRTIPEKLIYYRRHNQNTSTATGKSKSSYVYRITTRLRYMAHLVNRLVLNH